MRRIVSTSVVALASVSALAACSAILGLPDAVEDPGFVPPTVDGSVADGAADAQAGDGAVGDAPAEAAACTPNPDFASDKQNCGACGFDCTHGSCADGVCTLASALPIPTYLSVTATGAYFESFITGKLYSCALNGCADTNPRLLYSNNNAYLYQVAANQSHLFVAANDAPRAILAIPLPDGGTPIDLTAGALAPANRPYGLALSDAGFYFTNGEVPDGSVGTCPLTGCAGSVKILATKQDDAGDIALGPSNTLFWSEYGAKRIMKCTLPACTDVAPIATSVQALSVATDDTNVYFNDSNAGKVGFCPVAGPSCGDNWKVAAQNQPNVRTVAARNGTVYWSVRGAGGLPDGGTATDGFIRKCPAQGLCNNGNGFDVVKGLMVPYAVKVDDVAVYWTDSGNGTQTNGRLMKAPR